MTFTLILFVTSILVGVCLHFYFRKRLRNKVRDEAEGELFHDINCMGKRCLIADGGQAIKGIHQYIFLLFHLEELLKLYVNLFYRFCVTFIIS